MAKMNREEFIQRFAIANNALHFDIGEASNIYDDIERFCKDKRPNSGKTNNLKKSALTEDQEKWFDALWNNWNIGIQTGSKGGKFEACKAFTENPIKTRDDAVMACKAAKYHSEVERPKLITNNKTPPYFNRWYKSGRWDTRVNQIELETGEAPPEILEIHKEIREQKGAIKQFERFGQQQLVESAKERLKELEKKLAEEA